MNLRFAGLLAIAALGLGGENANSAEEEPRNATEHPEISPGEFHFEDDSIILNLTAKGVHPKVLLDLGDGVEHAFIVDTGASVSVIDRQIAQDFGFETVGETEIGAPGGNQIPGEIVRMPIAHIGEATISNLDLVTMDLDAFSGGTMQGVLSLRVFEDYLLTYNLSAGEIIVSRGSLSADDPAVQAYRDVAAHLSIDVDVAGTIVASHVDTGSMGGFMMPIELKDSLRLSAAPKAAGQAKMVGGSRKIEFGVLDGTVTFAGKAYDNPNLAFLDPSPGAGNIGGRVLMDFIMTIDQRNHRVRFEELAADQALSEQDRPRQVGMMFRNLGGGGAMTLATVIPDSLAANAGLKPDDVLLAINGTPMAEYDMQALGSLFRSHEPLHLKVERDGEPMTFDID